MGLPFHKHRPHGSPFCRIQGLGNQMAQQSLSIPIPAISGDTSRILGSGLKVCAWRV